MNERLFSYGTLQMDRVQRAVFGRLVPRTPDTLSGHVLITIGIRDADAVATSGIVTHLALVAGDGPPIRGVLLDLTAAELAAADAYEGDDYRRVAATFGSGATGWVYVAAGAQVTAPLSQRP